MTRSARSSKRNVSIDAERIGASTSRSRGPSSSSTRSASAGVRVGEARAQPPRELAHGRFLVLRLRRSGRRRGSAGGAQRQVAPELAGEHVAQRDRAQLRQRGVVGQLEPEPRPRPASSARASPPWLRSRRRARRSTSQAARSPSFAARVVEDDLQDRRRLGRRRSGRRASEVLVGDRVGSEHLVDDAVGVALAQDVPREPLELRLVARRRPSRAPSAPSSVGRARSPAGR